MTNSALDLEILRGGVSPLSTSNGPTPLEIWTKSPENSTMAMPVYDEELAQRGEKAQVGQTVTVRTKPEDGFVDLYRPTKFQSNITILSCVSRY